MPQAYGGRRLVVPKLATRNCAAEASRIMPTMHAIAATMKV
ncbi:hypothetical protein [Corynebacterium sp. CNJ-954]|nr:hypothetical protein [Corynebacterium sp. CNJ-954]